MKTIRKRLLFLLIATVFVCLSVFVVSCGDNNAGNGGAGGGGNDGGDSGAPGENQGGGENPGAGEPEEEIYIDPYVYPELDGGGRDFKFYNVPENVWEYYTDLAFEEPPSDILDDAVYKRNRFVEEKFNINIVEINMPGNDMWNHNPDVRRMLMAGDDTYDAIFIPASFNGTVGAMLSEGLFHDLRSIPTMDLDKDYWNQTMLKEAAIGSGDQIFYAGSSINLFTTQAMACVFFNQDIMQNTGIDLPYSLVKEGKWTYDAFMQYQRSGASLNGASSFDWEQSGTAIYGLTAHNFSANALLAASGARYIASENGRPALAVRESRFFDALQKIGEILDPNGGLYLYANDYSDYIFHYENIFRNGRALMAICELKAANVFRAMESNFGIVPMPKYDENQEDYQTLLINQTPVLIMPHTNSDIEFTGAVLDALAYVSNRDVVPVLFDVAVSQKQLRNEESIEMLELIKNRGSFEIGMAYGWTNTLVEAVATSLGEAQPMDVASQIDRHFDRMQQNIERTLERFE
ncbi:MAG: hypothetical protein FWH10_07945 [Oscillospiraceae bacterium]|nr:hypothetical protein [Oscillospiraceae bacterium]